ncbi:MAG: hypothetical protein E6Q66_00355 [Pedobacter sp.]|nr:MAG: hypothetical protein E6Q66_00355 [Pedobacter sp.]
MKQKFQLKNLLKTKPARLTIDEMMIDPAFTVLTDEQKAAKKAGFTDDVLVNNNFESRVGLMNVSRAETKFTRTKRDGGGMFGANGSGATVVGSPINNGNTNWSGGPSGSMSGSNPTGNQSQSGDGSPHTTPQYIKYQTLIHAKHADKLSHASIQPITQKIKQKPPVLIKLTPTISPTKPSVTPDASRKPELVPSINPINTPKVETGASQSTLVNTSLVDKTNVGDEWKYKNGGTSIPLPEVLVKTTPTNKTTPLPNGSNLGGSITGPGTDPLRSAVSKVQVANPSFTYNGSTRLYDAMVNMMSSIDLTLSGTQAAAKVMEVNLPKFMGVAGKVSYLGPLDNVRQIAMEGFNWNDAAQAVAGTVLIGFSATLGAPVVFIGTLGLFAWELGETYINQQKN